MRFYTASPSRPAYYDRNPAVQFAAYSASAVAPHTATVRATYTVPTGKKAYLESLLCRARRNAAASAVGQQIAYAQYTPSGGAASIFIMAELFNNTVGATAFVNQGQSGLMAAGDIIDLVTVDNSTTGSGDYNLAARIVQYDA